MFYKIKLLVMSSIIIHENISSRARALWRSFFLPFYRPTHSLCACLSACSDIYDMSHSIRTLLLFFRVLKSRWKQHQSSDCHIQVPTDHFWGCVGVFYRHAARLPRVKVYNCASFVHVSRSKFTTFCDQKGYSSDKKHITQPLFEKMPIYRSYRNRFWKLTAPQLYRWGLFTQGVWTWV